MGDNEAISTNQIQNALGSEQVKALAAKMGIDPAQASGFLAEYLPKIVDKLTPAGKSILPRIISKDWRLCSHRCCKASVANHPGDQPAKNKRHIDNRPGTSCDYQRMTLDSGLASDLSRLAGLSPSLIASASLTYLPFFVLP